MKFALATANPGKIEEMREILAQLGIEVLTREELGIDIEIEETGDTFFENALIKARAICAASGMPAIADDSGLVVAALDGAPGVYSSSFGGETLDDKGRREYLLKKMENMEQRDAKFVCTIICMFPNGDIISAEGESGGAILTEPRGTGGFGYDPVFITEGMDRANAELTQSEKNAISHRGKALREFAIVLKEYCA